MLSSLVRLPLIFISGVFVPHADMPAWGQSLSPRSPLVKRNDNALVRALTRNALMARNLPDRNPKIYRLEPAFFALM
jgi:hypothetical protein